MAHDVYNTIVQIGVKYGGYSEQESKAWIKEMKSSGKYQEDVWS
jgi:NADPH-ferrihemoprotein reductase